MSVDIGPGRGDFLFHLAAARPEACVCGIEIKRKRFCKLIERRERRRLPNIHLVLGDARVVLPTLFAPTSVGSIYVQFPDPWPKRRHAQRRLVTADFLCGCAERLCPGGEFWFVTDDRRYAESVAALCAADPRWFSAFPQPVITDCPDAYPTHFAKKWRAAGRPIYYQRYRKASAPDLIASGSA